ncbi:hypothetical protein AgCh_005022 [Apium graveolens]
MTNDANLTAVLQQDSSVFQDLTNLPPQREQFDHIIPLKEGTNPINLRPYRYSIIQKNFIEEMVQEMLEQGIIRPSSSPFTAPIILVKKKDGRWRICIAYRSLNKATVKDKFPIPIIEELLDELHGTGYFANIDLKSGYHQIRVSPQVIYKTAFKTHLGHYEYVVVPFGLTNAPSTFQALMNHIFKPLLRKGVLDFFDDILIYSSSWSEHLSHLQMVMQLLKDNSLQANLKKCSFGVPEIHNLGHVISEKGIHTEEDKIQAISEWPIPTNLKQLRGFLGLTGYYRRFIQDYGKICKPLNDLLRKDDFKWNDEAQKALDALKVKMSIPTVLALPNFNKPFTIETDDSAQGMGVVLLQEGHPIAFLNKAFSPKNALLSAYERELLAVVFTVTKWQHYLIGLPFIIKTDQESLKYVLEHKISTPFQQKWLSKLAGFDYSVEYKSGKENIVADALSRTHGLQLLSMAVSSVDSQLMEELKSHWENDTQLSKLISELNRDPTSHPHYKWDKGILLRKGKPVVGSDTTIQNMILNWMHNSSQGGHSGIYATLKRAQNLFFWHRMKDTVIDFIKRCSVCQKYK